MSNKIALLWKIFQYDDDGSGQQTKRRRLDRRHVVFQCSTYETHPSIVVQLKLLHEANNRDSRNKAWSEKHHKDTACAKEVCRKHCLAVFEKLEAVPDAVDQLHIDPNLLAPHGKLKGLAQGELDDPLLAHKKPKGNVREYSEKHEQQGKQAVGRVSSRASKR